ncbi:MAG: ParB N-terminal domain-containing protein [Syntrophomonadaceae bacterium]|jgi:DNA modification methylase|nr:ParB N-terminal domain-containing protein [Syntrophomonadaceae bacterium]
MPEEANSKGTSQEGLVVRYIAPNEVKPYQNNPKKHSEKQVTQIINSIKEFKFNNPLLIDENNVLIAGHGRLLAAKHLNLEKVPAIQLRHLTEAQKRAYRIADNKLTENGDWDINILALEFSDLEKLDLDFSLDITGFDNIEIDNLLNPPVSDLKLNNIPFVKPEEIVSTSGDVWQLGEHRIICGNALEERSFIDLTGGKQANMVFTDPPYNVKIDGNVCGKGSNRHKEFAMASGEMSNDEFTLFLTENFKLLKKYSVSGSLHYICMDWRHIEHITRAGHVYDEFKNLCVWNKTNAGMGSLYRSKHELVFVYKNGNAQHMNNVKLGIYGRYRTNVWDYAGVNSFGKNKDLLKLHPTVKPVELIWDAILDSTQSGDIVLDSFLGSGSTLIACEKAKRKCFGIELEPLYIDTTIRRWEDMTGKNAVRQDGKTYSELIAEKQGASDAK